MKLVEEAYRYTCAQRLVNFYVPFGDLNRDLFKAFNYEERNLRRPKPGRGAGSKETVTVRAAYKRSQFYVSDYLRKLPMVTRFVCEDKTDFLKLKTVYDKWSHKAYRKMLYAAYQVEMRAIKDDDKVIGKSID